MAAGPKRLILPSVVSPSNPCFLVTAMRHLDVVRVLAITTQALKSVPILYIDVVAAARACLPRTGTRARVPQLWIQVHRSIIARETTSVNCTDAEITWRLV